MSSERGVEVVDAELLAEFSGVELEVPAAEPDGVDPLGMSGLVLDALEPVESGPLGRELDDSSEESEVELSPEGPG